MKMSTWYRHSEEAMILTLYVQPGAKRTEIVGFHNGALKIRLSSPPMDGLANKALLKYMSMLFDVPVRQIKLKHGDKSRRKVVIVTGSTIDPDSVLVLNDGSIK
jgi:uncharacterized protein